MDYRYLEEIFSKMRDFKPIHEAAPDFQPRLKRKLKEELPDSLKRAWDLAVFETESNIKPCPYGGEYITAGGRGGWWNMLFGQDTVSAGLLAYNRLYPEVMKQQIRSYVLARLNIGFMAPDGWVLQNCDRTIPLNMDVWVPHSRVFCERYFISPALNRTGTDVGWIWAAGDLFDVSGDRMDWAWLFGMGELFFEYFYSPFYDEKDGLYFGSASYIDCGGDGYPREMGDTAEERRNATVWIKASSTNALYVRNMDVLAHAAHVLDRPEDEEKWKNRAEQLRKAIREHLRLPDGTFSYFLHKDGRLEERREALGAAYCVLADVVTGKEAVTALALDKLPVSKAGVPVFYPFYEHDYPRNYHNRSTWPFVSTYYFMACEKATGKSYLQEDACQLANAIAVMDRQPSPKETGTAEDYQTGTFKEMVRWADQKPDGTCAQVYTISAFMNLCLRSGWLDAEIPRSRFW